MIEGLSIRQKRLAERKTVTEIKESARKRFMPELQALIERKTYLVCMLMELDDWAEYGEGEFPGLTLEDIEKELAQICTAIKYINYPPPEGTITDEMKERANEVPIPTLIEFKRGTTACIDPTHKDKHPSAYYASRINRLVCPVCNKVWDAIAVKMHVSGLGFHDAIRSMI